MHADNVSDLEDFWMILQFLTEDGAADLLVGLISNLQAGAEVCGKKPCCGQIFERQTFSFIFIYPQLATVL